MKEKIKKALPKRILALVLMVAMAVTLLPGMPAKIVKADAGYSIYITDTTKASGIKVVDGSGEVQPDPDPEYDDGTQEFGDGVIHFFKATSDNGSTSFNLRLIEGEEPLYISEIKTRCDLSIVIIGEVEVGDILYGAEDESDDSYTNIPVKAANININSAAYDNDPVGTLTINGNICNYDDEVDFDSGDIDSAAYAKKYISIYEFLGNEHNDDESEFKVEYNIESAGNISISSSHVISQNIISNCGNVLINDCVINAEEITAGVQDDYWDSETNESGVKGYYSSIDISNSYVELDEGARSTGSLKIKNNAVGLGGSTCNKSDGISYNGNIESYGSLSLDGVSVESNEVYVAGDASLDNKAMLSVNEILIGEVFTANSLTQFPNAGTGNLTLSGSSCIRTSDLMAKGGIRVSGYSRIDAGNIQDHGDLVINNGYVFVPELKNENDINVARTQWNYIFANNIIVSGDSQVYVNSNDESSPAIIIDGGVSPSEEYGEFRGSKYSISLFEANSSDSEYTFYYKDGDKVAINKTKVDTVSNFKEKVVWQKYTPGNKSAGSEMISSAVKVEGENDPAIASSVIWYSKLKTTTPIRKPSDGGNNTPGTTVPVSGEGTSNATVSVSGNNATVSISSSAINSAAGNTSQDKTDTITVDLSGLKETVTSTTISKTDATNLANALNSAANNKQFVEFKMAEYSVKVDATAMNAVVNAATGSDLRLVVETTAPAAKLNSSQKAEIANKEVARTFEAYFVSNGTRIGNFNGGKVQVGVVKFNVPSERNSKNYHIEYLPESGKAERLKTRYVNGNLIFNTTHFSDYAIVYDEKAANDTGVLAYRLYDKNRGEHIYTIKKNERDMLVNAGWIDETTADGKNTFYASPEKTDIYDTAVYRSYNPYKADPMKSAHMYTKDKREYDRNVRDGWEKDAGIVFYVAGSAAGGDNKVVYRAYNPNSPSGEHQWTVSKRELDALVKEGWSDETKGNAWYSPKF